ncbi:hypothetical protein ACFQQE_00140 [Glycomyces mayteni]|uniref:hypothetical protein n=1 Tax=Glycomyces mayteni TaxID=543887 RepID=UPI00360CB462
MLDIERFGRFTDSQSTRVASSFRDAVEQAFERSGLADTYAAHAFMQNQGDGIVAGFDESRLPQIVDRVPNALQSSLRELHQQDGFGVRMRMGVSYGPVQGIADKRVDVAPNRTVVDACRIADAEPTRSVRAAGDRAGQRQPARQIRSDGGQANVGTSAATSSQIGTGNLRGQRDRRRRGRHSQPAPHRRRPDRRRPRRPDQAVPRRNGRRQAPPHS